MMQWLRKLFARRYRPSTNVELDAVLRKISPRPARVSARPLPPPRPVEHSTRDDDGLVETVVGLTLLDAILDSSSDSSSSDSSSNNFGGGGDDYSGGGGDFGGGGASGDW